MSTATLENDPVTLTKAEPRSLLVLGEESVFAPKVFLEIGLLSDDPARAKLVHLSQLAAESHAARVMEDAAAGALRRAEAHPKSSTAWSQAGFAALAAGLTTRAAEAFSQAIVLEPGHRNASLGLARAALQGGSTSEAELLLRTVVSEHPNDDEALVGLAVVLTEAGNPSAALKLLVPPLEVKETDSLLAVRGGLWLSLGQYDKAIGDLRKAARRRIDWVHVRNALGIAELKQGNSNAAERSFRECVRIAPLYTEGFENLLRVMMSDGRFGQVLAEIENRFSPIDAPLPVCRIAGRACLTLQKWANALPWLESAVQKTEKPRERARILNDIGCAHGQLGRHKVAGKWFAQSVDAMASELAIVNRGRAFMFLAEPELALQWLASTAPPDGQPSFDRLKLHVRALWANGDAPHAAELGLTLLKHPGVDAETYAIVGGLLVDDLHDPVRAVAVEREGFSKYPGNALLANNLAYSLLMADQIAEAESVLSVAPATDNAILNTTLTATRGLLALKQGNLVTGQDLYEEALRRAPTEALRERVRAKRDLEVGRTMKTAGRLEEAAHLFKRASEAGRSASPYGEDATAELRLLKR